MGSSAPLNDLAPLATVGGFRVAEVSAAARTRWEAAANAKGIPLALSDLQLWHAIGLGPESTLCSIHDHTNELVGGFAVQRWPSKALPGHHILRLERLGQSIPAGAELAIVQALLALATRTPRVLELAAELHDRDADRRSRIAAAFQASGFRRKDVVRMYERTLALDLQRSDEALFGSFSTSARGALRRAQRFPLSVVSIESDALISQLDTIHRETYDRTGGRSPAKPWAQIAAGAREAPDRMRLFGAVLRDQANGPRLVAFAEAVRHGTFAVYNAGGSTRHHIRRIPLMYPLVWALIQWARATGAAWLDFGGVTNGSSASEDDPVGGVSEFKRRFGGEEVVVGEDWHLEVAPLRQRLVRTARKVVGYLKLAAPALTLTWSLIYLLECN